MRCLHRRRGAGDHGAAGQRTLGEEGPPAPPVWGRGGRGYADDGQTMWCLTGQETAKTTLGAVEAMGAAGRVSGDEEAPSSSKYFERGQGPKRRPPNGNVHAQEGSSTSTSGYEGDI